MARASKLKIQMFEGSAPPITNDFVCRIDLVWRPAHIVIDIKPSCLTNAGYVVRRKQHIVTKSNYIWKVSFCPIFISMISFFYNRRFFLVIGRATFFRKMPFLEADNKGVLTISFNEELEYPFPIALSKCIINPSH